MNPHPLTQFLPEARRKDRISAQDRRTERVVLLVSPKEKDVLHSMATERKCQVSTILRAAIHEVPPTRLNREVLNELHSIGADLSRLVREVYHGFPDPEATIRLVLSIQQLYQQLQKELTG